MEGARRAVALRKRESKPLGGFSGLRHDPLTCANVQDIFGPDGSDCPDALTASTRRGDLEMRGSLPLAGSDTAKTDTSTRHACRLLDWMLPMSGPRTLREGDYLFSWSTCPSALSREQRRCTRHGTGQEQ